MTQRVLSLILMAVSVLLAGATAPNRPRWTDPPAEAAH